MSNAEYLRAIMQAKYTTTMVVPMFGQRVTGTWDAIRNHLDGANLDFVYEFFRAEVSANTDLSRVMHLYLAERSLSEFEQAE